MAQGLSLSELLEQARRRVLGHLILDKGALALAIGMGGVVVLLLAGTQILNWYWPLLLALVSLGVGIYQLRPLIPSVYELAQRIDHALNLNDSLSTAVHFGFHPKSGAEDICMRQREIAEQTARRVDLEQALPTPRSKYLMPAAGLLMVALGLFAVRYAVVGSLDLNPSLLAMAVDTFFTEDPEQVAKMLPDPEMVRQQMQASAGGEEQAQEAGAENPDDPEKSKQGGSGDSESDELAEPEEGAQPSDDSSKQKGDQQGEETGQQQGGDDQGSEQQASSPDEGAQQSGGDSGDQSSEAGNEGDPSLMDKLRDALANMMNQLTQDSPPETQQADNQKQQPQEGQGDSPGEAQEGQEQTQGEQQQASSSQQGQQGEAQQGNDSNEASQQTDSAASGAGSNDGEKDIEQAALLEAMGEVSELLGKRAEEVSGEVMMEVAETEQRLRTELTTQTAGHTESGSQIHRDEIPRIHQQYVAKYFEEVHRQATAAAAAAEAANAPAPGANPPAGPVQSTPLPPIPAPRPQPRRVPYTPPGQN